MAGGHTREFKVYEHGGRNTEICKQFTRKIEEKGSGKKTVRTDIPSFLYVHEVNQVFHDIKSALNSAGNINSYAAVVVFRKLTPNDKPDSSDLYSTPWPLEIPDGLPIVACYWFENDCKQQLCDCEENEKSVKKLVRLIKGELQTERKNKMARVQTREFKVYEHGGRNTEICKQFTRKIEEKGNCKVSVRTDITSFLYVHEVTRVFHDIKSALNSAGNINSYAAVVIFRKLTPYEKPDSSDLYPRPWPLEIPDGLPIVACYWFENDCKQQLCDCEENKKSVKKLVRLIKGELQTDTDSGSPSSQSSAQHAFRSGTVGGQSYAPAREPPRPEQRPEPLLPNPWREVEFSDDAYKKLCEEITNHQPQASTRNILISDNVGSGKSSFLNSVLSELRREELNGRVQNIQAVRPGEETSVTQRLRCHTFNDKIKIFDTAGFKLEKTGNATIILKKIDGEVAEDIKFDDILKTKSSMEGDKIHCVVLVISIHTAENLALIQFYEELIGMLIETGVPCQLLVTLDKLVEKTEDLKDLYRRRDIKKKIEMLAKEMRISMSNSLVVSNYEEMEINQIKGTLLLEAFAQILTAAKVFQERM